MEFETVDTSPAEKNPESDIKKLQAENQRLKNKINKLIDRIQNQTSGDEHVSGEKTEIPHRLRAYQEEYIAIVSYLESMDEPPAEVIRDRHHIWLSKGTITVLLDRNKYDTATNKLQMWKRMQWIETDKKRLTKRKLVNGERIPFVKIRKGPAEILGEFYDE